MATKKEDFGDRPKNLIAAFAKLDKKKTGTLPTPMVMALLTKFDPRLTPEEQQEFLQEADDNGVIRYEKFVKDIIFGDIK
jgi:Ca2+-binding EF-hand superfamily protein